MRIVRDYEVSIWTLQDSFITVLKPYGIELKGLLQEPDLKIVDDGTIEFTFNLPMYYTLNGERLKNSLWDNIINGTIVANMRKAKIIFKKHQQGEKVIELMITKVTESHDKDLLMCEVSCEGLAFHELGKIGYKIALETDDLIEENIEWFKGDMSTSEPRGTLQYWNDKVFKLASGNWKWNWIYEIQMDYSNNLGKGLKSNKVYEDAYVSSWDYDSDSEMIVAQAYVDNAEKERTIDLTESNVYNLTLDLAKLFGVFCRYEYEHDENYHICGRKVIYYNNFIVERLGALDITYPYDTSVISRTSDSTDLVTKLYVQTSGNDNDGEPITITNSSANKTREDYILNFDYLWRVGAITKEQYEDARKFETNIFKINNELIPILNLIIVLEAEKPELEGKLTILKNSIMLDLEQMAALDDLLNALTDNTGVLDITNDNPKTALIITNVNYDVNNPTDYPNYIKITELGIDYNTLKIYKKYNTASHKLSFKVEGKPQYDEFNNLVLIHTVDDVTRSSNATWEETDDTNNSPTTSTVYMIYLYSPELLYKRVKLIWKQRLKNDENNLDATELRLSEIEDLLINLKDRRDELLAEKELEITRLERTMGAALREGYWQPEDYNDYGDKHLDNYSCVITDQIFNNIDDTNANAAVTKFFYDTTGFDSEQKSYLDSFTIDGEDTTIDYPCIEITSTIAEWIQNRSDAFSLIFYDVVDVDPAHKKDAYRKIYHIGSQCLYAFIKDNNNNVIPVIMVTGAINDYLTNIQLQGMAGVREGADTRLAVIDPLTGTVALDENKQPIPTLPLSLNNWYNKVVTEDNGETTISFNETIMVYPRIQITSLNIRTDNDEILVKYNGHNLENYKDYQLLIRNNSYYINLKPEIFARYGFFRSGLILYIVSNANTMIYLDALQVSKENSLPKVEYNVTVNAVNQDFIEEDYNYLGYIAHINDTDLKFENVYGYVSELHLKLDKPLEDEVTIKNYKTKFEDLFTSIVAQTEQMLKNSTTIGNVGALFDAKGDLIPSSIEKGINKLDLTEAFNKGTLTWDDAEGLWATSDSGVVAIRGGGIFSATLKNPDGSWHWNTGLTPEGINADLITTGQLDTNRIKVYAGDELKLLLNADGLFAYKTGWDGEVKTDDAVDYKQYVVHDASGLFLIAENGATIGTTINDLEEEVPVILNTSKSGFAENSTGLHNHKDGSLERVAISWDGLTLRNWNGDPVFYADPNNGNLTLKGKVLATGFELVSSSNALSDLNNIVAELSTITTILGNISAILLTSVNTTYYASVNYLNESSLNSLTNNDWKNTTDLAISGLNVPYYIYTRTVTTYGNNSTSTAYIISRIAKDGSLGNPGGSGTNGDYITSIVPLYYLKTTSTGNVTKPNIEITTTNNNITNAWTTAIPQYVASSESNYTSTYYRCELYTWHDKATLDWSAPCADFGLTFATKNATSASSDAAMAKSVTDAFIANGLLTDYWWPIGTGDNHTGGICWDVALTSAGNLLIGANGNNMTGGIWVAKSANYSDGAAVVIDSSGIAIAGSSINFNSYNGNEIVSDITINNNGINLGTNGTITMAASNFNLTSSGTSSLTLSDYINTLVSSATSSLSIAPDQIWANVTSWMNDPNYDLLHVYSGNLKLSSDGIDLVASLDLDNDNLNDTISSFSVNTNGLILDYTLNTESIANITMNENGISLTGSNIEINDKPIWSHENIVIMNPNATGSDAWRKTVSTIEAEMTGRSDWVLIKPSYDAKINYIPLSAWNLILEGNSTGSIIFTFSGSFLLEDTRNLSFAANGGEPYTYTLQFSAIGPSSSNGSYIEGDFNIYISNTELNAGNYNSTPNCIVFPIKNSTYTTNAITGFGKTGSPHETANLITSSCIVSNNINLCTENTTIYYFIRVVVAPYSSGSFNGTKRLNLRNPALTCEANATNSRVPCTVYYYP